MATTDWDLAGTFQTRFPHTFNALQQLIIAMAAYQKNKGKKTLFGKDKGLAAYKKFESALKDTLLAMVLDGAVARNVSGKECRETLTEMIAAFAEVFPNWQDAYSFADEYFINLPLNKTQQIAYNTINYNKLENEDEKGRNEFFRLASTI